MPVFFVCLSVKVLNTVMNNIVKLETFLQGKSEVIVLCISITQISLFTDESAESLI